MDRRRAFPASVLAVAAVAAIAAVQRLVDAVEVRGRSMAPALEPGDRLVVVRARRVKRGDVVLANDPREPRREMVKRVASITQRGAVLRGDNPAASTDARTFGALPVNAVRWRVALRYWPPRRFGRVPRAAEANALRTRPAPAPAPRRPPSRTAAA